MNGQINLTNTLLINLNFLKIVTNKAYNGCQVLKL